MKHLAKQVGFWMLFSFVCAMWMTATACPQDDIFCIVKE